MADVSEAPVLPALEGTALHIVHSWRTSLWQVMRFGLVGVLNTTIDLVTLNILLWQFPTHSTNVLLAYNSIAYLLGALNSFGLNKYWTFKRKYAIKRNELVRFVIVNVVGILCNDGLIWIVATLLRPLVASNLPWANISKLIATAGTMIISYLGMRLWVFAVKSQKRGVSVLEGESRSAEDAVLCRGLGCPQVPSPQMPLNDEEPSVKNKK